MTDAAPPLDREHTVDEGFAGRAAAVMAGESLRSPWPWIGLATAALAMALALLGAEIMWVIVVIALLGTVLLPFLTYFLVRRIARRQFPPGSVLRIGFGDEYVSTQSPLESSTTAYSMYSGAKRRGDFVLLRMRANNAWGIVPGQLFTDEDLARFPQS
jgi:hypothetical protein